MRFLTASWRVLLAGSLAGLAIVLLAASNPLSFFEIAELKALDAQFTLRGPREAQSPIVVVTIDEDSFDGLNLAWPWPRQVHAKFLDIVGRGGPAAIGMDILFTEPSSRGPADDATLGAAVDRWRDRIVLASALTTVGDASFVKQGMNPPIPAVRGQAAFGSADYDTDADAFVRRATLRRTFQDREWAGFDLLLYRLGERAGLARGAAPTGTEVLVNYRGGPGSFPMVAYHRVVSGEIPSEAFAGKIVLVGATTPTLHDIFPTPFASQAGMSGVEIHANTLETLFQDIPLRRAPRLLVPVVAVLMGAAAAWIATAQRPLPAFGIVAAVAVAYLAAGHGAFRWARYWVDVVPVPLALLVTYAGTVAGNFAREQRQKRRLSRFFSPAVVAEIIRHKDDAKLAADRRRMTVLFSDIRGFTSMSERMPPEEVVTFLREYLTVMTEAVFKHGGTVDKYIGDAIMALYNVPFEAPDHARRAVRTALEFQERLRPLAERFAAKYGGTLACGVGIHTGDAVVGTIGSEQRLEYTAIGDTINLGSRLEGLTKEFSVPIIMSEATAAEVVGLFGTRDLGEVTVKGKAIPVKIYAVLGELEAGPAEGVKVRRPVFDSRVAPRRAMEGRVSISGGELTVVAEVSDVSRTGLAVHSVPRRLEPGELVTLQLTLRDHPQPVVIERAEVMWARKDTAGLRFVDLSASARAALAALTST
ncbi:MAG TPA: CHASE2 domain-containing protein [Methylomirabilota bacterium]|nr:CHASE2 domain-containing protein [Methylomirabilota bacterium]